MGQNMDAMGNKLPCQAGDEDTTIPSMVVMWSYYIATHIGSYIRFFLCIDSLSSFSATFTFYRKKADGFFSCKQQISSVILGYG